MEKKKEQQVKTQETKLIKTNLPPTIAYLSKIPLSQWMNAIEQKFEPEPRIGGTVTTIKTKTLKSLLLKDLGPGFAPLVAGTKFGHVPETLDARKKDLQLLNAYIQQAFEIGLQRKIFNLRNGDKVPYEIKLEDVPLPHTGRSTVLKEFSLHPDSLDEFPDKKELLPIPHLMNKKISPPTKRSKLLPGMHEQPKVCKVIQQNQQERMIQLTWANLLTLFAGRWLDSVVIDSMMHVLQEHFPLKAFLYINSAESDPTLEEIKNSVHCTDMILTVLWLKSHWTCLAINHRRKRIRYLNSQLLSQKTADLQTAPFKQIFPDYEVVTYSPSQQNNGYDCGVYSLMSIHILMFYDEKELERIKPEDATRYRHSVLLQLILSYFLIPHNQKKDDLDDLNRNMKRLAVGRHG